jgi:Uma2 family endonuclease
MAVAQKLLTADEFAELPGRDDAKMELVRGEVVLMPPPGGQHGEISLDTGAHLREFVKQRNLGRVFVEAMYRLASDPDTIRLPDVSFLEAGRVPAGGAPEGGFEGPPTLAIEVTTAGDRDSDLNEKIEDYLAAGASRVWVLRPRRRTVTVHRPDGTSVTHGLEYVLTSEDAGFAEEGLTLPVSVLFESLGPAA